MIDGKSQLEVLLTCGSTISSLDNDTNLENEKSRQLDEDKAYGEYVTQRLKNIKNSTVKQDIKFEIDYLFYTKKNNCNESMHN